MKLKKFLNVLCMSVILSLLLIGCKNADKAYSEQKIISIDEEKIYLDEMMYHVMIAEFQGKVIGSYFGGEVAYWESEYENGISMSENKQKEILQDAIKYQIYFEEAEKEGMSLDETEKEQAKQTVLNMQRNIGDKAISLTQLSDEKLQAITEKVALATKYYNDHISKIEIDEKAIRATLNKEDYEIYKLQYLFMSSKSKNNNDEIIEVNSKTNEEIYEKMQTYRNRFLTTTKLDEVVADIEDEGKLQTGEISFKEKEQPFGDEIEIVEECKKLSGGEISEVFKTQMGYYVIRRIEDIVDPYEQAVKEAISNERERKMQEEYEQLKKQYKINVNDKEWKRIEIGSMTVV